METSDTKIYIDGQPVGSLADCPELEFADHTDETKEALRDFYRSLEATLTIPAGTLTKLANFYTFVEALQETIVANPKRWHILCYTKRVRIANKHTKAFMQELVARIDAKRKAREDHASV